MKLCVLLNLKVGSIFGDMIEANGPFNLHTPARRVEVKKRNAVAEDVVHPPQTRWLGKNREVRMQQSLIKAVAWAKHHTMLSQTNGPLVSIPCQMSNDQNGHDNLPEGSGVLGYAASTLAARSDVVERALLRLAYDFRTTATL
jgi:hypothetical protein